MVNVCDASDIEVKKIGTWEGKVWPPLIYTEARYYEHNSLVV